MRPLLALLLLAALAGPALAKVPPAVFRMPEAALEPVDFAALEGWAGDDHAAAFATFRKSCTKLAAGTDIVRPPRSMFAALRQVCAKARRLRAPVSAAKARAFFEAEFRPLRIGPVEASTTAVADGFLTGYYEPEVEGSRTRSADYAAPLYRRPPDLIAAPPPKGAPPSNKGQAFRRENGELVPYYDRAAIEDGALAGRGLEICWIKDPSDAFFAHIQGSVRVRLAEGGVLRLNYDGHNGQAYTPVGRLLVERGLVPREKMSMDAIRSYIADHPDEGLELMRANRSYVFFRIAHELSPEDGAMGAQGLPLTPGRSIAVDRALHVYGTPFFVEAALPLDSAQAADPFQKLMIAQDTGSAIIGPARADLFFGAGDEAGSVAGRIRHPGRFAVLVPRRLDPARWPAPRPLPRPADAPAGGS